MNKSKSVDSLDNKSIENQHGEPSRHGISKSTERKRSSSRPIMNSLDLRTSELIQCKVMMEEKQTMFNNLISIKRITLDRSRSGIQRRNTNHSKDSVDGSQSRDGNIGRNSYNCMGAT